MKASLSLFGCCVLTDTIGYARDDKKTDFWVKNWFFQISPVSMMLSDPIEVLDDFEPAVTYDLHRKSISCDIHKNMFEFLKDNMTDYILIDVDTLCHMHLEITVNEKKYYLSYADSNFYGEKNLFALLEKNGAAVRKVRGAELKEYWDDAIKRVCEKILELFPPDRIIFLVTVPADLGIRRDGSLVSLNYKPVAPEDEKSAVSLFLKYVPDCHVIEELHPTFSIYSHKVGLSQHHYAKPYYEYAYKALDIITDQWPRETELKKLKKLNTMYSAKVQKMYDEAIKCTVNCVKSSEIRDSFSCSRQDAMSAPDNYLDKIRSFYDIHVPYCKPFIDGTALYNAADINQYVSLLRNSNAKYILFGAVNDIAVKYWKDFAERRELSLTEDMGFQESYIFVYDFESGSGKEIHDGTRQRMSYQCKLELADHNTITNCPEDKGAVGKEVFYVNIYSKGWEWSRDRQNIVCYASIMINNVDYSMNRQGMNFVLFSKEERCVVDSFYVNFWMDPQMLIRRV